MYVKNNKRNYKIRGCMIVIVVTVNWIGDNIHQMIVRILKNEPKDGRLFWYIGFDDLS